MERVTGMDDFAGYSIYELLEILVMRVGWSSQAEQAKAFDSVRKFREVNLFGNMAQIVACDHTSTEEVWVNRAVRFRCLDCGRML
jgi:hypothetical protein